MAVVIHTYAASCYFTMWGWCPIESILGSLMIPVGLIACVVIIRFIKKRMDRQD